MTFMANPSGFSIRPEPMTDPGTAEGSAGNAAEYDGGGPRRSFRQRRRNRHGRGLRGDLLLPTLPGERTRAERFDELVMESADRLSDLWGQPMEAVDFGVEDIPADLERLLGTFERAPLGIHRAATADRRGLITIYRRPIEQLADTDEELRDIIHEVIIEQAAGILNVAPEAVDPIYRRSRRL
jgi:predicted Zn-dependent protease with MMP-like domain